MIPYANFTFFGIMLSAVIPTLILGIMGRASRYWALCVTLLYLIGQFSGDLELAPGVLVSELMIVAGYATYQWLVAILFLGARRRSKSNARLGAALFFALAPLATTKFLPLVSPHAEFGFLGISYVTFRILDILSAFTMALSHRCGYRNSSPTSFSSRLYPRVRSIAIGASKSTGNASARDKTFWPILIWQSQKPLAASFTSLSSRD